MISSILSTVQVVMVVMTRLSLILSTVWVAVRKLRRAAQKLPKEAAQKLPTAKEAAQRLPRRRAAVERARARARGGARDVARAQVLNRPCLPCPVTSRRRVRVKYRHCRHRPVRRRHHPIPLGHRKPRPARPRSIRLLVPCRRQACCQVSFRAPTPRVEKEARAAQKLPKEAVQKLPKEARTAQKLPKEANHPNL